MEKREKAQNDHRDTGRVDKCCVAFDEGKYHGFTGLIQWGGTEGWAENADFELAVVDLAVGDWFILNGVHSPKKTVIWHSGTWVNGVWECGEWTYGTWKDGTWMDGTWMDGDWFDGSWKTGVWRNGVWHDGHWHNGEWLDGGFWYGTWHNGTWHDGTWFSGKWINGTWLTGKTPLMGQTEYHP